MRHANSLTEKCKIDHQSLLKILFRSSLNCFVLSCVVLYLLLIMQLGYIYDCKFCYIFRNFISNLFVLVAFDEELGSNALMQILCYFTFS